MERTETATDGAGGARGDDLETLRAAHRELERRLEALSRHVALTSDERLEQAQLKKQKLRLKDRMLLLETRGRA
jgi:uncharacterized protein YdcH (DUF465 family)